LFKKVIKYSIRFILLFILAINIYLLITIGLLKFINPPTTAFIQQSENEIFLGIFGSKNVSQNWVPLKSMSNNIIFAVIASEDQRFLDHFGIDFTEFEKVIEKTVDGKKSRGASTITQQTAKNLFLFPQKTFVRKGIEIYYSFFMELIWGKKRIMECYLNIAQFGKNIYGVEAASQYYFNKSSQFLSSNEAVQLAAILPNPIRLKIKNKSRYLINRIARIENQIDNLDRTLIIEELKN